MEYGPKNDIYQLEQLINNQQLPQTKNELQLLNDVIQRMLNNNVTISVTPGIDQEEYYKEQALQNSNIKQEQPVYQQQFNENNQEKKYNNPYMENEQEEQKKEFQVEPNEQNNNQYGYGQENKFQQQGQNKNDNDIDQFMKIIECKVCNYKNQFSVYDLEESNFFKCQNLDCKNKICSQCKDTYQEGHKCVIDQQNQLQQNDFAINQQNYQQQNQLEQQGQLQKPQLKEQDQLQDIIYQCQKCGFDNTIYTFDQTDASYYQCQRYDPALKNFSCQNRFCLRCKLQYEKNHDDCPALKKLQKQQQEEEQEEMLKCPGYKCNIQYPKIKISEVEGNNFFICDSCKTLQFQCEICLKLLKRDYKNKKQYCCDKEIKW